MTTFPISVEAICAINDSKEIMVAPNIILAPRRPMLTAMINVMKGSQIDVSYAVDLGIMQGLQEDTKLGNEFFNVTKLSAYITLVITRERLWRFYLNTGRLAVWQDLDSNTLLFTLQG